MSSQTLAIVRTDKTQSHSKLHNSEMHGVSVTERAYAARPGQATGQKVYA